MSWPTSVPKIKDGISSFSESDINPIIEALETRTTLLRQNIINDNIINGTGFSDIGLNGCKKGQFVAYSTKQQKYVPAQPIWNTYNELPTDESCVIGLVISDITDGQGTILTSGIIRNSELLSHIMNNKLNIPGNYYLKADGYVTSNINELNFPIHCGTLTASGCFVLGIQVPDFRTHNHTNYTLLPDGWSSIRIAPAAISIPTGSVYYYNPEKDPSIANILRTYVSGLSLVVNGQVLNEYKDYIIQDGYIWLKKSYTDTINGTIYATNPFMGITPWLTSMATAEDEHIINIKNIGTTAILSTSFEHTYSTNKTGYAVTAISNKGVELSPVVTSITGGVGINVQKEDNGSYKLSALPLTTQYVEMNILNGNGIIFGGDESCLFKFPANRSSSIIGTVRTPNVSDKFNAKIFMYIDDTNASTPIKSNIFVMSLPDINGNITTSSFNTNMTPTPGTGTIHACFSGVFTSSAGDLLNVTISVPQSPSTLFVRAVGVVFDPVIDNN